MGDDGLLEKCSVQSVIHRALGYVCYKLSDIPSSACCLDDHTGKPTCGKYMKLIRLYQSFDKITLLLLNFKN